MEKNSQKIKKIIKNDKIVRIIVFRSNTTIYAQAFDENEGKILSSASSLKMKKNKPADAAAEVGIELAKKISRLKVKFIFDRNGYQYHGQVKALAEGLRQSGINI